MQNNKSQNVPGLAVDIDDTLADTFWYFINKLQERFGNPEGLSIDDIVRNYRIMPAVPYWQTPEIIAWLEGQSLLNEVQEEIPVIDNAAEVLREIHTVAPVRMYITSRPRTVIKGTRRWLQKNGFPEAKIVMRPESKRKVDGNAWKADIIQRGFPSVAGLVDDNPEVLKALGKDYPGTIFIFGQHHNNYDGRVRVCPDWDSVRRTVFYLWKNYV